MLNISFKMSRYLKDIKDAIEYNNDLDKKRRKYTLICMGLFIVFLTLVGVLPFPIVHESVDKIIRLILLIMAGSIYIFTFYFMIKYRKKSKIITNDELFCHYFYEVLEKVKKYSAERKELSSINVRKLRREIDNKLKMMEKINANIKDVDKNQIYENSYIISPEMVKRVINGIKWVVSKNIDLKHEAYNEFVDIINDILEHKKKERDIRESIYESIKRNFPEKPELELDKKERIYKRVLRKISDEQMTLITAIIWTFISFITFFILVPYFLSVDDNTKLTAFVIFYTPILLAVIFKSSKRE